MERREVGSSLPLVTGGHWRKGGGDGEHSAPDRGGVWPTSCTWAGPPWQRDTVIRCWARGACAQLPSPLASLSTPPGPGLWGRFQPPSGEEASSPQIKGGRKSPRVSRDLRSITGLEYQEKTLLTRGQPSQSAPELCGLVAALQSSLTLSACSPGRRQGQWRRKGPRGKCSDTDFKPGRLSACMFRGAGSGAGAGKGSCQSRAEPLESCYCLRTLLGGAPSKKSLLEKARLETSRSQRASEPCEMT